MSKPREWWIRPDEPFGGEHICPHPIPIDEGYDFFQKEAVHVVEYAALVAAQAEIERLTEKCETLFMKGQEAVSDTASDYEIEIAMLEAQFEAEMQKIEKLLIPNDITNITISLDTKKDNN